MIIKTRRFGELDISDASRINFPKGLIGFPQARSYVLIRRANSDSIGWLQAVDEPDIALPVVSAHAFVADYPDVSIADFAAAVGLGRDPDELAVLVVLTALPNMPPTVNLLAPVVINAGTRRGAQILLDGTRFTTRELFTAPKPAQVSVEVHVSSPAEISVAP